MITINELKKHCERKLENPVIPIKRREELALILKIIERNEILEEWVELTQTAFRGYIAKKHRE